MTEDRDPYAVLGVTSVSTLAEINHAFRAKLRALHPDTRHRGAGGAAGDIQLQQLIAAYHLLRDPHHRAQYDRNTGIAAVSVAPQRPTPSPPQRSSASAEGPQTIPVTHHRSPAPAAGYLLWAGPVRRHR
jgi:curved DNA-binding protein CbpA